MGAFDTLPSRDPEAMADLAAAALEQDPNDWRLVHVAAHLRDQHPQVAEAGTWPDDNLYAAHEADHRDSNHDHTHSARHVDRVAGERARPSRWRSVQRTWEQARTLGGRVLANLRRIHAHQRDRGEHDRAPQQHRFAADREQALMLGTRAVEALRVHNHPDPERRQRAVAGGAVQAKLRAAGHDPPTREEARRAAELTGTRPVPQRPVPEHARGGPER